VSRDKERAVPEDRQPRTPRGAGGGRPAGRSGPGSGAGAGAGRGRSSDKSDKPAARGPRSSSSPKPWESKGEGSGRPARGEKPSGDRGREGKPSADRGRGGARDFSRPRRDDREERPRTVDQAEYDGPEIPEEITGKELDRNVAAQLSSLPEKLGQRVARHLVAAGQLLDTDPKTAYKHTLAARARASRLAVVREAVGEAAYAAGEFQIALSELRAAKRMNGVYAYIPMMADCERALGRPDRALALVKNAPKEKFESDLLAELTIVEAGARLDRKEFDAALRTLENAPINSKSRAPWVARLRYAYADALLAAGRPVDAMEWFHRTEAIDVEEATDAAERAAEIEKTLPKER
jgi:predicted negative regulator of RcsB-dependent stress response